METIFEVIDRTDDEMYYPLGIFLTLEAAKKEIIDYPKDERISEFSQEEFEEIAIIERKIGWSGNGETVFTLERNEYYSDDDDEFYWETTYKEKEA